MLKKFKKIRFKKIIFYGFHTYMLINRPKNNKYQINFITHSKLLRKLKNQNYYIFS